MDVGKMHIEDSKVKLIKLGLGLVALVALVGGYMLFRGGGQPYVMTTAPKGDVVSDFPKELLLEKGVSVDNSYSLNYSGEGFTQPVVQYVSALNIAGNIGMFKQYLLANNWQIEHEADLSQAITYFTAKRQTETVNITLVADKATGKVNVNIAYAKL